MANPLWLKDILVWNKLSLKEQLEAIRVHLCTGPCGQSSSTMQTRSVISNTLKEAIEKV